MLKKLMSLGVVSIISMSLMVGCSSSELTKVDSDNTLTQVQRIMKDNYTVLNAKLNDGTLVVQTQLDYSGNWDHVFKRNLHAIEDICIELDLSNINELQYWSVCQTTSGGVKKTFSCSLGKEQLQMIQDRKIVASDIGNMTSKMTDLYLDSELLLGLTDEVASQIIVNNKSSDAATKSSDAATESNDEKEPQQTNTKKDSSNTAHESTRGDRGKNRTTTKRNNNNNNTTNNKKDDAGVRHPAVEQNREEWCPVCQEWYDPNRESHNCEEVGEDYYDYNNEEQDNSGHGPLYSDDVIEDTIEE